MKKGYTRKQLKEIIMAYGNVVNEELEKTVDNITRLFVEALDEQAKRE